MSLGLVPLDENFAVYTFHYIAAAHAVQYIWVTLYFDRKTHPNVRRRLFYGKSLFAGSLIWGLPLLLFAPLMNGSFSFSADLALLVAAIVNIHHFVLDGAIWKLRDQKVGGVLVKEATSKSARSVIHGVSRGNGNVSLSVSLHRQGLRHCQQAVINQIFFHF